MTELAPVLGLLAGAIGVADMVPYLRDTVRGRTRPHRGTWLVWSLLAVAALLSQRADGASWSLVTVAVQAVLNGAVLAIALRRGLGGVRRDDLLVAAIVAGGVVAWVAVDEPFAATAAVVAADLLAMLLMVPKTWRDPWSETLVTFAGAGAGGALATLAATGGGAGLLLYPAYYCLANTALAALIAYRRRAGNPIPGVGFRVRVA